MSKPHILLDKDITKFAQKVSKEFNIERIEAILMCFVQEQFQFSIEDTPPDKDDPTVRNEWLENWAEELVGEHRAFVKKIDSLEQALSHINQLALNERCTAIQDYIQDLKTLEAK